MAARSRRARIEDVHELALGMPGVKVGYGPQGNPVYQVGSKSFVFFRNPRPDATHPGTGERYPDVIVFWVPSEADKQALVQDRTSPFFTTSHFVGIDRSNPGRLARSSIAHKSRRLAQGASQRVTLPGSPQTALRPLRRLQRRDK